MTKRRREPGGSRDPGRPTRRTGPDPRRREANPPAAVTAEDVRPAPAEPRGPNRQARKQEARRQRELLRRRQARRKRLRVVGSVVAVALVVTAIAAYVLTRPDPAAAAGCTPVQRIDPYPNELDQAHVGTEAGPEMLPDLSTYPSQPPVSGPHLDTTLPAGVYETAPPIGQVLHSLEHGAVVVWYAAGSSGSELEEVKNRYADATGDGDHVIVAPYDYPDQGTAGSLSAGQSIALVAWGHLQTCEDISADAVQSFVARYRVPTGGPLPGGYPRDRGAPEAGAPI